MFPKKRPSVLFLLLALLGVTTAAQQPSSGLIINLGDNVNFNTMVGELKKLDDRLPPPPYHSVRLEPPAAGLHSLFSVDRLGAIMASRDVDRDELCGLLTCCLSPDCLLVYRLQLQAAPGAPKIERLLRIRLEDENDQPPVFPSVQPVDVPEDANGTLIPLPAAVDRDSPRFGVANYSLEDSSGTFALETVEGQPRLRLSKPLDRERVPQYQITLRATDGLRTGTVVITVRVGDVNDNAPVFDRPTETLTIPESWPVSDRLTTLPVGDQDDGLNAELSLTVVDVTPAELAGHFEVLKTRTVWGLHLRRQLDFERPEQRSAEVRIEARDSGIPSRSASATVTVSVVDVNDNPPTIEQLVVYDLYEHGEEGGLIMTLKVTDVDSVSRGKVSCKLQSNPMFELRNAGGSSDRQPTETITYNLYSATRFDFEVSQNESVDISCLDSAQPEQTASRRFVVPIRETNDFAPAFPRRSYFAQVSESLAPGVSVLRVQAVDKDKGESGLLAYYLDSLGQRRFRIGRRSGVVELLPSSKLDRELQSSLQFEVIAVDSGQPSLNASVTVVVKLLDENDNAPAYTGPPVMSISEDSPVGAEIGRVSFDDPDEGENGTVQFALVPGRYVHNEYLLLNVSTGALLLRTRLDRELQPRLLVLLQAWDLGSPARSATASLQIKVLDVNDNAPVFTTPLPGQVIGSGVRSSSTDSAVESVPRLLYTNLPVRSHVVAAVAIDPDAGANGDVTFSLRPGTNGSRLFGVDHDKGEVHTWWNPEDPLGPPEPGIYSLTLVATDSGSPHRLSGSAAFYVRLTAPPGSMHRFGAAGAGGVAILIVIIAATVLIAAGLVAAIFYVRAKSADVAASSSGGDARSATGDRLAARSKTRDGGGGGTAVDGGDGDGDDCGADADADTFGVAGNFAVAGWSLGGRPSGSPAASLRPYLQPQQYEQQHQQPHQHRSDYLPMERVSVGFSSGGVVVGMGGSSSQTYVRTFQHPHHQRYFGAPSPRPGLILSGQTEGLQQHERRLSEEASVDDSGRGGSIEDVKVPNGIGTFVGPLTLPRSGHPHHAYLLRPDRTVPSASAI